MAGRPATSTIQTFAFLDYCGEDDFDDSDEFCSSDFDEGSSYHDSDESDFDPDDYFESNYGIYPKDEKTPSIVEYAVKHLSQQLLHL